MSNNELKFALGDKVIVIDDGRAYNHYTTMARLMRLNNHVPEYIEAGAVATVVAISLHNNRSEVVLGLQTADGSQYIIGQVGVESTSSKRGELRAQIAKLEAELAELS